MPNNYQTSIVGEAAIVSGVNVDPTEGNTLGWEGWTVSNRHMLLSKPEKGDVSDWYFRGERLPNTIFGSGRLAKDVRLPANKYRLSVWIRLDAPYGASVSNISTKCNISRYGVGLGQLQHLSGFDAYNHQANRTWQQFSCLFTVTEEADIKVEFDINPVGYQGFGFMFAGMRVDEEVVSDGNGGNGGNGGGKEEDCCEELTKRVVVLEAKDGTQDTAITAAQTTADMAKETATGNQTAIGHLRGKDTEQDAAIAALKGESAAADSRHMQRLDSFGRQITDLLTADKDFMKQLEELGENIASAEGLSMLMALVKEVQTINTQQTGRLDALDAADQRIDGQLEPLVGRVAAHEQSITDLQAKDTELDGAIGQNRDDIATLRTDSEAADQQHEQSLAQLGREIGRLDTKDDELMRQLGDIATDNETSAETIRELQRLTQGLQDRDTELNDDIATLRSDSEAADATHTQRLDTLGQQIADLIANDGELGGRLDALASANETAAANIRDLMADVGALRTRDTELNDAIGQSRGDIATLRTDSEAADATHTQRLDGLDGQIAGLFKADEDFNKLLDELGKTGEISTDDIRKLADLVREVKAKDAQQDGRLDGIEAADARTNEQLGTLTGRVTVNEQAITDLRGKDGEQDTAIATAQSTANDNQAAIAGQNTRLDALEDKDSEQDGRIDEVTGIARTNETAIIAQQQKNAEQDGRLDDLEAKDAELDRRIDGVRDTAEGNKQTIVALLTQSGEIDQDITDLQTKDGELASDIRQAQNDLAGLRDQSQAADDRHGQTLANIDQKIANLLAADQAFRAQLGDIDGGDGITTERFQALLAAVRAVEGKDTLHEGRLTALEDADKRIDGQLEPLVGRVAGNEQGIQQANDRIAALEGHSHAALVDAVTELRRDIGRIRTLTAGLDKVRLEVLHVQDDVNDIKGRVETLERDALG